MGGNGDEADDGDEGDDGAEGDEGGDGHGPHRDVLEGDDASGLLVRGELEVVEAVVVQDEPAPLPALVPGQQPSEFVLDGLFTFLLTSRRPRQFWTFYN